MRAETRTTYAEVDPRLMPLLDRRDEDLRLAQFRYSRTVMAGSRADFRVIEEPIHENQHD